MIFLSFRVPMSKFGAKVELRCNDGKVSQCNDSPSPLNVISFASRFVHAFFHEFSNSNFISKFLIFLVSIQFCLFVNPCYLIEDAKTIQKLHGTA